MIERHLTVPRTARYYTLGTPSDKTRELWIVCHGYGQLARYFMRHFSLLNNGRTVIIAPEGLSRFYLDGYSGRVGATWMTKEDRLTEIQDQATYLSLLLEQTLLQLPSDVKVTVLGFSQGTATVCRWLATSEIACHRLILWAGAFPPDIGFSEGKAMANRIEDVRIVYGTEDKFISPEALQQQEAIMQQLGIRPQVHTFDGGHTIDTATLQQLAGL